MQRVSVEEFRRSGLSETRLVADSLSVPLGEAIGRISSREVKSHLPLPWFRRSAVDGYALRHVDRDRALTVVAKVTAGRPTSREVGPGEAVEITTGAPMPEGADAVALVEMSERSGDVVRVHEAVAAGSHVSPVGEDFGVGQVLLAADAPITPIVVASLASQGYETVEVWRRPRVAILSTGDELVPLGATLNPGQVYDVNGAILEAMVREAGGDPVRVGTVADRYEDVRERLQALMADPGWDMLVSSGGTGASIPVFQGRDIRTLHDLIPGVAGELGTLIHHGIRMSPGRPTALVRLGERPLFALPGWPYAVLVHFQMLVEPAVRQAAHLPPRVRRPVQGKLQAPIPAMPDFTWVIQVRLERQASGPPSVVPLLPPPPPSASRVMTQMLSADGIIIVEANEPLEPGTEVTVWTDPLGPLDVMS
jgi:molybdenum cofactor synthesis domain-containing protein